MEVFVLLQENGSKNLAVNGFKRSILMLQNFQRKPHIVKNTRLPKKGEKGGKWEGQFDKNFQIFQKKFFAYFCELNHSEQENQKKNFGKILSLLTLNIPDTQKKNQNFQKKNISDFFFPFSILMILILTNFKFHFTRFRFLLVYLTVMDLEIFRKKILNFFL